MGYVRQRTLEACIIGMVACAGLAVGTVATVATGHGPKEPQVKWDRFNELEEWRNDPDEWPAVVHYDPRDRELVQQSFRRYLLRKKARLSQERIAADLERLQGTHLVPAEELKGSDLLVAEAACDLFRDENPSPEARSEVLRFQEPIIAGWDGVIDSVNCKKDGSYVLRLTLKPRLTGPAIYFFYGALQESWTLHMDGRLELLDTRLVGRGMLVSD